jgi:hypothetical protein
MKTRLIRAAMLSTAFCAVPLVAHTSDEDEMTKPSSIYEFTMKSIDGKDVKLSTYEGGVLLIVNVASQ